MTKAERVWRVFYTAPRAEKACEERMAAAGLEVFLPKVLVTRQWSDRKKKVLEPLFPNYIFACITERQRLDALQVSGIVRSVSIGGQPARVADDEITNLQIAAASPESLSLLLHPRPAPGDQVQVVEGPLKGLSGEVLAVSGETYVVIRLSAIGQSVRVRVSTDSMRVCDRMLQTNRQSLYRGVEVAYTHIGR